MTHAVFTTSASSAYDDQPEVRYHFPATYLRAAQEAVGDWIVYYEPRRTEGPQSRAGRQSYFAMAQVTRIVADESKAGHYYAYVSGYLEFEAPVHFRAEERSYESALTKQDGSVNKGAFGRAVRLMDRKEFDAIVADGFTRTLAPWEERAGVADPVAEIVERPTVVQVVTRKYRDEAFRRHVRLAYSNTCAITGLRLINGGGRPEVQAAHIRPVEFDGPDTVRNGLALTGTVHWMFDRGIISVDESLRVLVAKEAIPAELAPLVQPGTKIRVPEKQEYHPHPTFLQWHRVNRFMG